MTEQIPSGFTIRVYALLINDRKEVLVTDEFQLNMKMTKFPGGGLDFGEGTIDCLKRELMEECHQEIDRIQHFYTTDFYQKALFWDNYQLISIYYLAALKEPVTISVSEKPFDFPDLINGNQSFRWVSAEAINSVEFTFPIDKHVAHLLKEYLTGKF
jgi:ADP-ribose pyrophosphatase YjhB (NUDIX family)